MISRSGGGKKNYHRLRELVQEEDGIFRLHLVPAVFALDRAQKRSDNPGLLCQVLKIIETYGGVTSHLLISAHFLELIGQSEDRDILWNTVSQLPNITKLTLEDFGWCRLISNRSKRLCLPVPDLIQLLEHFQPRLEELHLANVEVAASCPDDIGRLCGSLRELTHLKTFRAIDTKHMLGSGGNERFDDVVWSSVAALPEIETFHLEYKNICKDPALTNTVLLLSNSKSLQHIFLKGPDWNNLDHLANSLIGTQAKTRKHYHNGRRKASCAQTIPLIFESLHFEGPCMNKEGLIALVKAGSTRVQNLSFVNNGGCDFVDDEIICALAKILQNNETLKHLHVHPMSGVSSTGYKALLNALQAPAEQSVPSNTVLGHFPLGNVQDEELSQELRRLLTWNKYGLRRYVTIPAPDEEKFCADMVNLLESHPRDSPKVERDLLDCLFGLFSDNVGLLDLVCFEQSNMTSE